jgi:L-lactate dehydrogenase complex protein LldG
VTARETVLGRVRDALALAPQPAVTVERAYRRGRTLPDHERRELFADRLVDYKAQVRTCTASETAATVADVLAGLGARRIGVPAGLDRSWLSDWDGTVEEDRADVPAPRLEALDAVVTASAVSCAESGTIFLDGSSGQGRRALSLVPDVHLCVVDLSSVAGAGLYGDGYRGRARMVVDLDDETLRGVTFVGPGVGELLHSASIAVSGRIPVNRLWHAVPSYPTISEVWLRLLEAYRG